MIVQKNKIYFLNQKHKNVMGSITLKLYIQIVTNTK